MTTFKLKCPGCGIREISQNEFIQMLSDDLRKVVGEAVAKGAVTITAVFESICPNCSPSGQSKIKIVATWVKMRLNKN